MTFIAKEDSIQDGSPIELYEFRYGGNDEVFWASTSLLMNMNGPENSTKFKDEVSNLTFTSFNGADITTTDPKYGTGSLLLNGTNQYIQASNSNAFKIGTGDFTIEAWIYPTDTPAAYGAICSHGDSVVDGSYFFGVGPALQLHFNYNTPEENIAGGTLVLNTWSHVAVVLEDDELSLYINGVSVALETPRVPFGSTNGVFRIGRGRASSTNYFEGKIDDLRLTKAARYTTTFTPPVSELSRYTNNTNEWFFTSSDQPYTDPSSNVTYTPIAISRGNITFSADGADNPLDIRMQNDVSFVELFRAGTPYYTVSVTLRKVHRTDTDDDIIAFWKGRIADNQQESGEIIFSCESIRSGASRFGLRRVYQYQCPHVLYGSECKANKDDFSFTATLTSISGLELTITGADAYDDGYFTGGYIQYIDGILNAIDRKMITSHVGNVISVMSPVRNLEVTDSVTMFAGCSRAINVCDEKFDNSENFGGFPYTPPKDRNPFGGGTVY